MGWARWSLPLPSTTSSTWRALWPCLPPSWRARLYLRAATLGERAVASQHRTCHAMVSTQSFIGEHPPIVSLPPHLCMCLIIDNISSYYVIMMKIPAVSESDLWQLEEKNLFCAHVQMKSHNITMHWRHIEFQYGSIYWGTQFLENWFFFCWCYAAQVVETLSSSFSLLARARTICIMYKHISLILPKWGGFLE